MFDAILDIKRCLEDEEGRWIVEGFATTADVDSEGRLITEEALEKAQKDLLTYSTILHNHNRDEEIGKVLDVRYIPDEQALWIKAMISKTRPDIWTKVKEGVLSKFSIRGTARQAEKRFDKNLKKEITIIDDIELKEVSLVSVPAQPEARTLAYYIERSLKGGEKEMSEEKDQKVENQEDQEFEKGLEDVEEMTDDEAYEEFLNELESEEEVEAQVAKRAIDALRDVLNLVKKGTPAYNQILAVIDMLVGRPPKFLPPKREAEVEAQERLELTPEVIKRLIGILDKVLGMRITNLVRNQIRKVKAALDRAIGGTYPYPPPYYPPPYRYPYPYPYPYPFPKVRRNEDQEDDEVMRQLKEIKDAINRIPIKRTSSSSEEKRPQGEKKSITETEEFRSADPSRRLRMILGAE